MIDFEKKYNLVIYQVYKKPICYWTKESLYGIKIINGLYLKKDELFGKMPEEVELEIKFNYEFIKNSILLKKYYKEFNNSIYIKDNYFYLHSVLKFQNICDQNIFYLYRGDIKIGKKGSKVKEVYFHKEILGKEYPDRIPIILKWKDMTDRNDEKTYNLFD